MPAKRYKVTLEPDERGELERLISRGKGAARPVTRSAWDLGLRLSPSNVGCDILTSIRRAC